MNILYDAEDMAEFHRLEKIKTEKEVVALRIKLAQATSLIEEMKEYLEDGSYLGQEAGMLWLCKQFLGGTE